MTTVNKVPVEFTCHCCSDKYTVNCHMPYKFPSEEYAWCATCQKRTMHSLKIKGGQYD